EILAGSFPPRPSPQAGIRAPRATPPGAPAAPLVGRDAELETVEELLDGLFAGRGGLMLLSGEAGVGKSRLAAEVAARARRRGATVLAGAAYEQEGRLPYGPFVEAFGVGGASPSSSLDP